jgi:hypothetical protein
MTSRQTLLHITLIGVAAVTALNYGCAALSPDCAQDWYDAGLRDGRYGTQSWDMQHSAACGARFDRARYVMGWQAGASARPLPSGM